MRTDPKTLRELADRCTALGVKTEDADTAAELLRISYRLLQLANPELPSSRDDFAEFNRRQMIGTA